MNNIVSLIIGDKTISHPDSGVHIGAHQRSTFNHELYSERIISRNYYFQLSSSGRSYQGF